MRFKDGSDGLKKLKDMLERGKNTKAALARVYKVYQKLQVDRFMTENSSEGQRWDDLNPKYAAYKRRRYGGGPRSIRHSKKTGMITGGGAWGSYPGQGTKMLVGTSFLAGAVIGRSPGSPFPYGGDNHSVLTTEREMRVAIVLGGKNPEGREFDYPEFVAERRPFMEFSEASKDRMRDEVRRFILGK